MTKLYNIGERVKFRAFGTILEGTITGKQSLEVLPKDIAEKAGGYYAIRFGNEVFYKYGIDLNPKY